MEGKANLIAAGFLCWTIRQKKLVKRLLYFAKDFRTLVNSFKIIVSSTLKASTSEKIRG